MRTHTGESLQGAPCWPHPPIPGTLALAYPQHWSTLLQSSLALSPDLILRVHLRTLLKPGDCFGISWVFTLCSYLKCGSLVRLWELSCRLNIRSFCQLPLGASSSEECPLEGSTQGRSGQSLALLLAHSLAQGHPGRVWPWLHPCLTGLLARSLAGGYPW